MATTAERLELEIYEPNELVPQEITSNETVLSMNERAIVLLTEAQGIKIVDDDSDNAGAEIIVRAKDLRAELLKARSAATTPYERTKKAIIAWFNAHEAPLEKVQKEIGRQHLAYQAKKDEQARKETERLRKLAEAKQARQAAKAEAQGLEAPPVVIPMPTVQAPPKTVKTASGSLTTRRIWKHQVVDFAALPEEYKIADEVKLGKVVRAGVREIPGVRIYEEMVV